MAFFTVQARDDSQRPLFEVDVSLTPLWSMVDTLVDQLRSKGVLASHEPVLVRLVPHVESQSDEVAVRWIDRVPADIGEQYRALYPIQAIGAEQQPLQGVSVWLCARAAGKTCEIYWPIRRLLHATELELRARLAKDGAATGQQWTDSAVSLRAVSAPSGRSDGSSTVLLIIHRPDPSSLNDAESAVHPADFVSVAPSTSGRRYPAVSPARRSWSAYDAKLQGTRQRGDLRILVDRRVFAQLDAARLRRSGDDAATGGLLVGAVHMDPEDESLFVDVSDIVIADRTAGWLRRPESNSMAWQRAIQEVGERFPDKLCVGWWRTRMLGGGRLRPIAVPELGNRQVFELVDTGLLSATEAALHRSLFPEPWQISMAVDLMQGLCTFYQWKRGGIALSLGYYVYDHAPEPGALP